MKLRQLEILFLGVFSYLVHASLASAGVPGSWTQYQGNARHTGHMAGTVTTSTPAQIWNRPILQPGENIFFPPAYLPKTVVDDSQVYVNFYRTFNGFLYDDHLLALDKTNGALNWSQQVFSGSFFSPGSAPSLGNSLVYVSTGNAPTVLAYNSSNGQEVFRTLQGSSGGVPSQPTVEGNQVIARAGSSGAMEGFDAQTGSFEWIRYLNPQDGWNPAVDSNYAYAYLGPAGGSPGPQIGTLYAVDRNNGSPAFQILNPADTSTLYNGTVFLGDQNDALTITSKGLVSFDLSAHSVDWHLNGSFVGSLVVDQNTVYAATANTFYAINESTGVSTGTWTPPSGETLSGDIVATDNAVILSTSQNTYALSRTNLSTLWSLPTHGDLVLGSDLLIITNKDLLSAYAIPEPSSFIPACLGALSLLIIARQRRV